MLLPVRRLQAIECTRRQIERDGFPRLQMAFLVSLTGAAGLLASYCLLNAGVDRMWLRYLLAVGIAYLVFLGLLWLWLRSSAADYADIPDMPDMLPARSATPDTVGVSGQGGSFDGGGASGWYESAADLMLPGAGDSGPVDEVLGTAAQAEELAVPLMAIVLIGAAMLSSLLVIYWAPLLFAELLVDGVLAASLYRRLRGLESRHWLESAVRRTWWPFMLTAFIAAAVGWVMSWYAPHALSIGGVLLKAAN